jgi:hypothetical protein
VPRLRDGVRMTDPQAYMIAGAILVGLGTMPAYPESQWTPTMVVVYGIISVGGTLLFLAGLGGTLL